MTDVTVVLSENHANRLCWLIHELTVEPSRSNGQIADLYDLLARIQEGQHKNALQERLREIAAP